MKIYFLVEDLSGERLIDAVMTKYREQLNAGQVEYDIKSYRGIGQFQRGPNAIQVKSQQLLNDLRKRLIAYDQKLAYEVDSAVFVVVDNDKRDTETFRQELEEVVSRARVSLDCVFCIAVEEMEAWLLGDLPAIQAAYPDISDRIASKHANYRQDDICDTWELLADMLTRNGIGSFRRMNPSSGDVGACKCEWASKIGSRMDIRENRSPSFQFLIAALDERCCA